jgi:hypothetical protein
MGLACLDSRSLDLVAEIRLGEWMYILASGVAWAAYFVLLKQSQVAAVLSKSWQKLFASLLYAMS